MICMDRDAMECTFILSASKVLETLREAMLKRYALQTEVPFLENNLEIFFSPKHSIRLY